MTSRFTQSLCLEDLCDWLASSTPSERHYIRFVSFFTGGKITQALAFELCRECRVAVEKVDRWLSVAVMDKDLTISVFFSHWPFEQGIRTTTEFKSSQARGWPFLGLGILLQAHRISRIQSLSFWLALSQGQWPTRHPYVFISLLLPIRDWFLPLVCFCILNSDRKSVWKDE